MQYRVTGVRLSLEEGEELLLTKAAKLLGIPEKKILKLSIYRKSLDARKGKISYLYSLDLTLAPKIRVHRSEDCKELSETREYRIPKFEPADHRPVVVGFGPSGMFAALLLAEAGLRPLVLERGKPVRERQRDVERFFKFGVFSPESNVQFGEGGAGTFSDGKLNTLLRDKNERGRYVLSEFVNAGAPEEILYQNKPHVGTDRLALVVEKIREKILRLGGEIRFETRFLSPIVRDGRLSAVRITTPSGEEILSADTLFLAIGHSARDTFQALFDAGVPMEKKIFSVGVRIEHLQEKINVAQYGNAAGLLPAADYKMAVPTKSGKTLYTFCMCPGGEVVSATSVENAVVTNGMSRCARDGCNGNSALLLNVFPEELEEDLFSGFSFQKKLEESAFSLGEESGAAPCQRVEDFLNQRKSTSCGEVIPSFSRGVRYTDLSLLFSEEFSASLREGIEKMGRILSGFSHPDAVLTGVESRATCPVRILRGENYQSAITGLFPIGEGAGYAGGIMSSAMDGMKAVEAYFKVLEERK